MSISRRDSVWPARKEIVVSQLLLIVGSSIFLLLGTAHGIFTFEDLFKSRYFTPRDGGLLAAMQQSTIALHPKINLWQAWMGFNLTHSLGLVMFGGAFLYIGVFHSPWFSQSMLLQAWSILIAAAYLVLSLKFFFSTPAIGSGISLGCFVLAAVLSHT
jgi:hypothetical protein